MTKISLLGDSQLTLPIATFLSQKDLYAKVRVLGDISSQQLSVGQDAVSASGSHTDLDHCRSGSILEVSGIVIICVGEVTQRFHLPSIINEQITQINPTAKVLVLGRSVCSLAASVARQLKDSPSRVIGIPPTFEARLRRQIANRIGVAVEDVTTFTVGNDEEVQIIPQYCRVNGIPIRHFLSDSETKALTNCNRSPVPVDLFTVSVAQTVDSIVRDKKRLLTVASAVRSDSTQFDVFLRMPTRIGCQGAESTLPLDLDEQQLEQFTRLVAKSVISQT
ncbi:MAG: hypothetical protein QGI86_10585 [Candidatus Poribacteria bacterium]|jgi:hypothetical protein|nr:hypothetical protein [Candidatus Poribacteria bacterium]MDP6746587.1 hypothetical protein [Candidatus Poribacteria bacterium]